MAIALFREVGGLNVQVSFFIFYAWRDSVFIKPLSVLIYLKQLSRELLLETNCELDPKAFAVRNINSGEVRNFGMVKLFKATLADELMIVLSEKFNQVAFDGEVVPVKRKVEIFQDCRKSTGIDGILKSFNEQFAAK